MQSNLVGEKTDAMKGIVWGVLVSLAFWAAGIMAYYMV